MRLAQLARKVSARPSEIVEFLAKRGIIIEENANSRIEDANAFLVIEAYAPALLEVQGAGSESAASSEGSSNEPEMVESPADELTIESPKSQVEAGSTEVHMDNLIEVSSETPGAESLPEVIKAPKVELKGLKVIGKIDLPEPRKKETPPVSGPVEEGIITTTNTGEQRARGRDRNQRKSSRPAKNPVAQDRERQAKETAQMKQREVEKEKERRKKYYANRVKPSVPSRSVRLVDEPLSTLSEEGPEKPKGLLRRFIHWLTTY